MRPDQIETTGQWAPPPADGFAETTGAFAVPAFGPPSGPQPAYGHGPYDGPPSQPFDSSPPVPGDVKVYGEPTVSDGRMPAWADAETSFLASGWSSDEEPEEEAPRRRRRGRKRPPRDEWSDAPSSGGKTRLALLGVAAVAIVLGGTVAGVKLVSSSEEPAGPVVATSQTAPPVSEAPAADTEEPTEEPTEEETTPSATPTATAPAPRRSSTPTPTPTKTKKAAAEPTDDPEPTPTTSATPEATETQLTLTDDDVSIEPTRDSTTTTSEPTPTTESQGGSLGPKVSVTLDAVKQRGSGYTAELQVVNDSAKTLSSLTVSVPVGGNVFDVAGADWTQDGDLLILDLSQAVSSGEVVTVAFSASGSAEQPETCGMVGGSCAVS